jgi:outer membrane protein assembly factor BamE
MLTTPLLAMRTRSLLALVACLPLLAACFLKPHKIDVQQGNFLDQETVSKLKPDMTRSQVRFLLGTPLITDPFHPERWDYLYFDRKAGRLKEAKRLTLIFENDRLKRALTDFPQGTGQLDSGRTAATNR